MLTSPINRRRIVSNIARNLSKSFGGIDVAFLSGLADVTEPLNLFSKLLVGATGFDEGFLTAGFFAAAFGGRLLDRRRFGGQLLAAGFLAAVGLDLVFGLAGVRLSTEVAATRFAAVLLVFFLVADFLADLGLAFFAATAFVTELAFFFAEERTDFVVGVARFFVEETRLADLEERFVGLKGLYPVNLGGTFCGIVGKSANCVKLGLIL